ncbi:MAG: bifunctional [glutamate--ammonia ligase]-adenylyl-L-tyrosine phosphorylase/[glutamate--ammonia-ligase] adenylyltransferase [Pseudomonadota bacterium]
MSVLNLDFPDPPRPVDEGANCPANVARLREEAETALAEVAPEALARLRADPERAADWSVVAPCSEFIVRTLTSTPELLSDLLGSGDLTGDYPREAYRERLESALAGVADERGLASALRRLRRREMVRIVWRDLAGRAPLDTTTGELTALADACISGALDCLHQWQQQEMGTPRGAESGTPQSLVVLGMGKLGAGELNVSSDIDLIFAYAEAGETEGNGRAVDNERYFTRLGQRLIQALDAHTGEGQVFRVDMRLRPFGESGALVASFDALETYYQLHGREWERYALIKARVVAGDRASGDELMQRLRPFVFRRYLDYGAFESLRDMKELISREVRRKGMETNVKLGAGGIREVEFIAQAFQLIRGGRDTELRRRDLRGVLRLLTDAELLTDYAARELDSGYVFLRHVEHRLQGRADRQTHELPEGEAEREVLAWSLGYPDWAGLAVDLAAVREQIHGHFEQVFAAPQTEHAESDPGDLAGVWQADLDAEQTEAALAAAGFEEPGAARERLDAMRRGHVVRSLSTRGRGRLDQLMPLLLGAIGAREAANRTLDRTLELVEHVAQRSVYLALLVENPMALSQLVKLCEASPWIAKQLGRHPVLLDDLLNPAILYRPPDREELERDAAERLRRVDPDDLENQMDVLRDFAQTAVLRVAAADVAEAVPLMQVSDHLTHLAEVVLERVLDIAWAHMVARHGRPRCRRDGQVCDTGFAIVGYGKLGGWELGYGSDLDLVFLHDSDSEDEPTTGDRPVASGVFFARLAQRIIHLLGTQTASGILYEVDVRLRPSGASGLLVTNLEGFRRYQQENAWTWEHQALVRARPVVGDPVVADAFMGIRNEVLARERDPDHLRGEVRDMRRRMRETHGTTEKGRFHLKQDVGGMADIEFIGQYGVLAWAHEAPELLAYQDNIRILERLAAGSYLSAAEAEALADAYREYRARGHRLTLQEREPVVEAAAFAQHRRAVAAVWERLLEERLSLD